MNQIFVIYRTCPFCNINPSGLFFSFQNKTISLLLFQRHWHCCMWHSGYYGPLGFPGQFICVFFFFFPRSKILYSIFKAVFREATSVFYGAALHLYFLFVYIFSTFEFLLLFFQLLQLQLVFIHHLSYITIFTVWLHQQGCFFLNF